MPLPHAIIAGGMIASNARRTSENAGKNSATNVAHDARQQAESLALDVEKLYMITEALWSIIKQQSNFDDKVLRDLISGIETRDGIANGRRKREARPDCPECGRKIIGGNKKCLYCGAVPEMDPFKRY